ncbi:MAG TPA: hypothetical protein VK856_13585 [Anaerolineaceae bacterium]|nr:hypothetical protein [Anaerolineaceae bacterium]
MCQRASATAYFQPAPGGGWIEPVNKLLGDPTTPPTHEVLVCVPCDPIISRFNQVAPRYGVESISIQNSDTLHLL